MTNRDQFIKNLLGMAELFDKELSVTLQDLYWKLFKDSVEDDEFEEMCGRAAVTLKFWPKPAELLGFIQGSEEAQALEAWETLFNAIQRIGPYDSIRFQDPRITRAVESLGGWQGVCLWENKDLGYKRHEFLRTYQALTGDAGPPRPMAGLIEEHNRAIDRKDHIPAPVVVGGDKPLQIEEERIG